MNILTTENVLTQEFNFIPRNGNFDGLFLTDEMTNVTVQVPIISSVSTSYYHVINAVFNLIENRFYTVNINQAETVVFKERIFCTNQPPVSFSNNAGVYVPFTTSNEFIIL